MNQPNPNTPTPDAEDRESAREAIRQARELVPVGATGVQITDLAQQVDYAQTMCKAEAAVPKHLRGKIGDCLAVIDISSRAGLSPYMVAGETYLQNDRLCFQSKLFHAFAQSSGLMVGDLDVDYEGDGDDLVCVVKGRLRSDPSKLREHRSPPLKDLHPGYTLKKIDGNETSKKRMSYAEGQKMKAEGKVAADMQLFPLGSPLWDRKPRVQMFYDTSRDWIRIYCPRSVLGIYTPEEMTEYGPDFARDVTPSPGLGERLRSGAAMKTGEGFTGSDAAGEVNKARNGGGDQKPAGEQQGGAGDKPSPDSPIDQIGFSAKTVTALKAAGLDTLVSVLLLTEDELGDKDGIGKATIGHIKTIIEKHGYALRSSEPTEAQLAEKEHTEPKTPPQWQVYCRGWLAQAKRERWETAAIRARWDKERQLRTVCGVVSEERDPVMAEMVALCKELGEGQ